MTQNPTNATYWKKQAEEARALSALRAANLVPTRADGGE